MQSFLATAECDATDLLAILETLVQRAGDVEKHAMRRSVFHALVTRWPDETLFKPFARSLRIAPSDVRETLVDLLPKVNCVADHVELCEVLRAPEAEARVAAARVLVEVGSKTAVNTLSTMMLERGFAGLREGLEVVMRVSGAQALPVLDKLLQRGDPVERQLALRWLGDPQVMARTSGQALRMLVPLLRDTNEGNVIQVVQAIGGIISESEFHHLLGPLVEGRSLKIATAVIECLRRFPTDQTADLLERKLVSGPNVLRLAALQVVESAATLHADIDPLLGPLVSALGHPHIAVRNKAAEVMSALSRSNRVEMGRTVVWLLRSPDVTVRRMAAEVLRSISDPHGELWPKLLTSLRDDDWWVRERVMDALLDLAGRNLSRYMVAWLQDPSDVVRRFALTVLQRLRDPDTVGPLVHTARTDPDWWAREKSIEVIAEFRDARAVPVLVELMNQVPELQMACIQALRILDPGAAAQHMLPLARSTDPDVRLLVLKFIEERNDPAHAPVVEPLKRDPDPAVQRLAHAIEVRWRVARGDEETPPLLSSVAIAVDDDRPLDQLLVRLVEADGQDLVIAPDRPVVMKRHGQTTPITDGALAGDRVASMLTPLVSAEHAVRLEQRKDVDFSYVVKATGHRFRVHLFRQRGGLSGVFRLVRSAIPVLEDLGLPAIVSQLSHSHNGLILVGGPTGSGKSTTLAAIIDYINRTQSRHIVSLEDPIEILHPPKKSVVNQREIGAHTHSYARALKSALRQDPDVLLVGELRDFESIQLALSAAETGHLVFGTVHTVSADASIERILNAYPRGMQDQARAALADSLRAILCQFLVRPRGEGPRRLALEVLVNNDAVANHIRKNKTFQIPSIVATSRELGMQSMDQELLRLLRTGEADPDDVLSKARNRREVETALAELQQRGAAAAPRTTPDAPRRPGT